MRSVNKVIVLGHLGKDAETNFTQSGVAVTKFSVATSRRWKDSQSDEWKEETDWHNVVLWRSENLANYLTKGKQVYVEGRLQTRSYEDRDKVKRYVTEIVADEVILLGGQQGAKISPRQARAITTAWSHNREGAPPRRLRLLLMIPASRELQTTTSLLIPARAASDLARAFIRPLGEAFRPAQA